MARMAAIREPAATYGEFRARSYFPALDGIRGVAVLAVVTWHVEDSDALHHLQGGRGVEWFFVLSGFLITTLALREEERDGSMAVKSFFIRRCFRILPLYLVAMAFYLVMDFVVFRSPKVLDGWAAYWPYYLTMLQDIPLNLGWPNAPFGITWSLGIEEKFYVVWPLLGFVVLSAAKRLHVTLALAAAVALLLLVWPGSAAVHLFEWYLPILLGCAAAILVNNRGFFDRVAGLARPAALIVLAAAVILPLPDAARGSRFYPVAYAVLIGVAVAAFAMAARVPGLGSRPMLWVGRRSYAVYLFHTQMIHISEKVVDRLPLSGAVAGAAVFLLALPASLVVADVVHRLVERPLIRVGRRLAGRPDRTGVPSVESRPA